MPPIQLKNIYVSHLCKSEQPTNLAAAAHLEAQDDGPDEA